MKTLLKQKREEARMTQDELAQALSVSRQTINSIETGRYVASLPLAMTIAKYFKTTVEAIFILETKEIEK